MTISIPQSASDAAAPLAAGSLLAPGYQIVAHLHRSAYLDVYDVWSEERDCRCAAKLPRPDYLADENRQRKLVREGELLARLTHPHIVRVYETVVEPHPVLILETLSGETLTHLLARRRRRLPLADVAVLGIHLCSAVHYLHRQGLLHLDLKPSNIVVDAGRAKLLDLSVARPIGRFSSGVGTYRYMAPEQARGAHLTEAVDTWGIGAVLYEAAVGRPPFMSPTPAGDAIATRCEQLTRRADPVHAHRRVPDAFAQAVDRCLARDPADRPAIREISRLLGTLV